MDGINSGDTAWILTATALVLLMTPALAFFYGGMVRKKNALSTLGLSIVTMGLIGLQWVLFGYTLAFGNDIGGFIGDLTYLGLQNVGMDPGPYSATIPAILFAAYQMTFAIITPALITGSFVDRIKFSTFIIFTLLWATVVYDPLAHWVWGIDGFIFNMGALDFAGGTVVHVSAGFAALAFAMVIGNRKHFGKSPLEPHNIPFTVLGAGLLWMGWFGFNGGSALAANGRAVFAIVNTNTAAAACALVWLALAWRDGKPSILGFVTGAVVGLVAITPAAGFVNPMGALAIGALAAPISYYAIRLRQARNLDESLDVWACHGMGGAWGALATGIFATESIGGVNGLLYGNPAQLGIQALALATAIAWSFGVTWLMVVGLKAAIGLRVSDEKEEIGLDISEHGEQAYADA